VLRVDRIEIDLGRFDAALPDRDRLTRLLAQAFADALASARRSRRTRADKRPAAWAHLKTLARFLQTGTLAWDASAATVAELAERLTGVIAAAGGAGATATPGLSANALRDALRAALRTRMARERLVNQFEPSLVDAVIRALTSGERPDRARAVGMHGLDHALDREPLRDGESERPHDGEAADDTPEPAPAPRRSCGSGATRPGDGEADTEQAALDAQRVEHAGLVLVHPFLPRYFEACGLVRTGEFVSREARHAGAHLLHFLATGQIECDEHTLTWPRMMVGCGPRDPVPRRTGLGHAWLDEGRALLSAVIEHWEAIGRTSAAGLRETFLQRPGVVSTEGSFVVRVESRGVDVLLDRLPWGLSVVKFPWLRAPIHVEW